MGRRNLKAGVFHQNPWPHRGFETDFGQLDKRGRIKHPKMHFRQIMADLSAVLIRAELLGRNQKNLILAGSAR